MARPLEQVALGDVRRPHERVAALLVLRPRVVLHELADEPALWVVQGQAAADLGWEVEQVELGAELAVIAPLGLLEAVEMVGQVLLRCPRRPVDPLQLRVVLVAPPVGAGHPGQLEVAEMTARVLDVGPSAQVDEPGRVLVGAHDAGLGHRHRVGRGVVDDLELVAMVPEDLTGPVRRDLVADERLGLGDDLAHPGVDAVEVVRGEVAAVGQLEVVVEAVLDRRTDPERRPGEQVEHGLGQHVRRRVADRVQPARIVGGDDADLVALGQRGRQVSLLTVDRGDDRRLAQPGTDGGGEIGGGAAGGHRAERIRPGA